MKPHIEINAPLLNISISEAEILGKCRPCEIRERLRPFHLKVRDGKMVRIVKNGMPYYVEVP
jgi:hypothetical protein